MWIQINNIDELEEGDIVEFPSKVPDSRLIFPKLEVPFVLHYGIIIIQDGEKRMGHNTFGDYPKIERIEKVLNGRNINRIIRTGIDSDVLIKNHNNINNKRYNFLFSNCEDYIYCVTGIKPGFDQRLFYGLLLVVMVMIIVSLTRNVN